jgi:hypothetical protein
MPLAGLKRKGRLKMRLLTGLVAVSLLLVLAPPVNASDLLIDDFNTDQAFSLVPNASRFNVADDAVDPYILGSNRDVLATAFGGTTDLHISSDAMGSKVFAISAPSGQTWSVTIQWDGNDYSSLIDPTGLGGVDLTDGGPNNCFGLWIQESDHPMNSANSPVLSLSVYTDAGNWSNYSLSSLNPIYNPGEELLIPFASFTNSGVSGGADFSNVGAIQLKLNSTMSAHDMELKYLRTTTPEPCTAVVLCCGAISCVLRRRKKNKGSAAV